MKVFKYFIIFTLFFTGCTEKKTKKVYVKSVPIVLNEKIKITQQLVPTDLKSNIRYGSSISLNKNYLAIGAEYGDGWYQNSGTVYMYKNDENANFIEIDKLKGSNSNEWQFFGNSVSVSGNYVAVGAYLEGYVQKTAYDENGTWLNTAKFGGAGRTYIFKNDGNDTYEEVAKLQPINGDITAYGFFGSSVSMDGNYTLIGSEFGDGNVLGDSVGSAFIFKNTFLPNGKDKFVQIAKLIANDSQRHSQFGCSVSMDGNYAVVGAVRKDGNDIDTGAAYVFKNDGNDNYTQVAKLTGLGSEKEDYFGASVAIDGNYIAIGAYGDDGIALESGAVYVFKNDGNDNYTQVAKLTVEDASFKDWLGYSISIKGSRIVAGAFYSDDGSLENSGGAYIFKNDGNDNYTQVAKLVGKSSKDNFGNSVSLSSENIAVGSLLDDVSGSDSGGAYIASLNAEDGLYFLNYKPLWQVDEDKTIDLFSINTVSSNSPLTYSLLGVDSSVFDVNLDGKITFNSVPDFENPNDNNFDNNYLLSIVLTDRTNTSYTFSQIVTVKDKVKAELNFEVNETIDRFSGDYIDIDGDYMVRVGDIYKKSLNGGYDKIFETGAGGGAVGISGDFVAISGLINYSSDGNGTVKIFKNDGNDNFIHTQTLFSDFADDSLSFNFGRSFAIKGDYLAIESRSEGRLYIYKKDINDNFIKIARIDPHYEYEGDRHPKKLLGSVAIAGDTIFAKGGNRWGSVVYVFKNDGNDNYPTIPNAEIISSVGAANRFANDISADADLLLISGAPISTSGLNQGEIYVYKKDINGTYISSSTYLSEGGTNVILKGDYAVVSAKETTVRGVYFAGAVSLFKKQENDTFMHMQKITAENIERYSFFGSFIGFDGVNLVIADKPTSGIKSTTYFYKLSE